MSKIVPVSKPEEMATDFPDIRSLFEAEEAAVLRYACSLTGRRSVAEEIVQDAFLRLHEKWDSVENPKAWLYRCIRNRAYNHHRDNKKEILTSDSGDDPGSHESPEVVLQKIEAAGFLQLLLSEMEEKDRRLVELKYYEDLRYADIAERTGLSVSNVGYRLHHILKQLAEDLRKIGIDRIV